MNPARSPITTGVLPSFSASAVTLPTTSGSVTTVRTTSTSVSTGAGLKKCIPTTLPGRFVRTASSVIDRLDVLEANTTSSRTIPSSSLKIRLLRSRCSGTASITKSTSARSASFVVKLIRSSSSRWAVSSSFPRSRARPVECSRCPRPRVTPCSSTSTATTSRPVRASTSAMPAPIVPMPTTPTVVIPGFICCLPRPHRDGPCSATVAHPGDPQQYPNRPDRAGEGEHWHRGPEQAAGDRLGSGELAQTVGTVDPAESGVPDPAEGQRRHCDEGQRTVDRDHPASQPGRNLRTAVGGEDRGTQPVAAGIDQLYRIVQIRHPVHGQGRAEGFLGHSDRVVRDVDQHDRLHVGWAN